MQTMSNFRRRIAGVMIDVTSHSDGVPLATHKAAGEPRLPVTHFGCGGRIIADADFVITSDGDEIFWNYRCEKCDETFVHIKEAMQVE